MVFADGTTLYRFVPTTTDVDADAKILHAAGTALAWRHMDIQFEQAQSPVLVSTGSHRSTPINFQGTVVPAEGEQSAAKTGVMAM